MVTVDIIAAVICFNSLCYPALIGPDTPPGTFKLEQLIVKSPRGYGGDVLVFKETERDIFAVHRTWPGREKKYDLEPSRRRLITLGCINVEPHVYEELLKCCVGATLQIK